MDLSSLDHKDVWVRALKTFVQAGAAALVVSGGQIDKSALLGALAAGLSAAWNYLKGVEVK